MFPKLFVWSSKKLSTFRRQIGDWAEELAAKELIAKKLRILARNWMHKNDELDIIAEEAGQVVFVEVRARNAAAMVPGYFTLGPDKRKALRRAINAYLCTRAECSWRFDVVEVSYKSKEDYKLWHYEGVSL